MHAFVGLNLPAFSQSIQFITNTFFFTIVELLLSKWENAYDQMHVMTALIFRNQGYLAFFSPPVFLPVQLLSSQKSQTLKSNKTLIFYGLIKLQFLFIINIIVEFQKKQWTPDHPIPQTQVLPNACCVEKPLMRNFKIYWVLPNK